MPSLAVQVFPLTRGCPVCAGTANARYHEAEENEGARLRRKCSDCGYTWEERPALRLL